MVDSWLYSVSTYIVLVRIRFAETPILTHRIPHVCTDWQHVFHDLEEPFFISTIELLVSLLSFSSPEAPLADALAQIRPRRLDSMMLPVFLNDYSSRFDDRSRLSGC